MKYGRMHAFIERLTVQSALALCVGLGALLSCFHKCLAEI